MYACRDEAILPQPHPLQRLRDLQPPGREQVETTYSEFLVTEDDNSDSEDSEIEIIEILDVEAIPISDTYEADDVNYLVWIIVANGRSTTEGNFTDRIRVEISNSGNILEIYPPRVTMRIERWSPTDD